MAQFEDEADIDWGEPTSVHDIASASSTEQKYDDPTVIVVEGTASKSYSGVSDCCDQGRVDAEMAAGFQAFIDHQRAAHPTLEFLSASHGPGTGRCRRWEDFPDGRKCNGYISAKASAYFRQP